MIHAFDPAMRPDAEFEPGELTHVVAGNSGRLLDPRRTPVTIVAVDVATGQFTVRIDAFEDRDATWDVPLEWVGGYQFAPGSARLKNVDHYRDAIVRFSTPLTIDIDPSRGRETRALIERRSRDARGMSIREFLGDVADLDVAFATVWASNPRSGELVKGHRIVLAELGLVPYSGTVVRTGDIFDGPRCKERRARHIVDRLAFLRAQFADRGVHDLVLYRGIASAIVQPRNHGFVSASFSREVAQSCATNSGNVIEQRIPVARIFMTYDETPELSARFQECEAVLLWDSADTPF